MQKKLLEWFRWRRVLSRQTKHFQSNAAASSRMFEIRAAIWRKLLLRLPR
jgi:hypothetical protein